jgi:hypothetical protein
MMVTESEAKKRWCPMDRHVSPAAKCATNTNCGCVASNCMMWRWEPQKLYHQKIKEARKVNDEMDISEVQDLIPRMGYCGLAGKQEV